MCFELRGFGLFEHTWAVVCLDTGVFESWCVWAMVCFSCSLLSSGLNSLSCV